MTHWNYQDVFEELESMRNYMDSLFQQIQKTSPIALLPASHNQGMKLLPGIQDTIRVTVDEYRDEVVVTAEIIPGDLKRDITIELINPLDLKISSVRREWKRDEKKGYSMCEYSYGYISQVIPLPKPVKEDGSKAFYKKGILKVHLKK